MIRARSVREFVVRTWSPGLFGALLLGGVCLLAGPPAMLGQGADIAAESSQGAAPTRAARLTLAQGTVTVETAQTSGAQPAQTNLPLLAGIHLATGGDGKAEVEFEDGSIVRLTPNSTLSLDTLSVDAGGVFTTNVSLLRGLAYAELRATPQYHYGLAAGADVLSPVENATLRVNFDEPPASFAVLDGVAEISRRDGGDRREVRAGETLRAGDASAGGGYAISQGIANDSWDAWNSDRDAADAQESGAQTAARDGYAGAQGYGWGDLDADGTWYDVPGQGQVWQPVDAVEDANFDPYGLGAWTWSPGAGYVWASGYAWGWTPYRCGAWNYFNGFGWGWSPGGACGGFGWAFWPGGAPVNIHIGPGGYRVPTVPHPHPGPVHPILPTRHEPALPSVALAGQTGWGALVQRGPREIEGVIATPVQRRAGQAVAFREGGSVSTALMRDFPVDGSSQAAVLGRLPSQPGLVHTDGGWQRANTPAALGYTGQSGAAIFRERQQQLGRAGGYGSPGVSPNAGAAVVGAQGTRPAYVGGGAHTPASGMGRPGYVSPAMNPRPGEINPGMRPSYTPPQQQMQVPRYAPAPVPMQRVAPAAPAPQHVAPPAAPARSPK